MIFDGARRLKVARNGELFHAAMDSREWQEVVQFA